MQKRVIAVLLVLALSMSLLAGCGGNKQANSGKTLIYAQGTDPRGLDPAFVDDGESAKVIANVYDGLLKYKADSTEIEPALATEWKISPDGKEYTFTLRKDVKFHDGTPFNADAVKFSIDRQLPPQRTDAMPYASFTFGPVVKVEKVDDYTVKIFLNAPYTPFLANLAMVLAAPIVSPTAVQKFGDKFIENPVGTGPFKFVSWTKGQSIQLVRNDSYWGGKAKVDKVVFKFVKENSVRASELMTGAVDIIDGVDPNDVAKLKESKLSIFQGDGMNINYLAFNSSRAPFNDPKLREALSHAINTEELVKYLYQGYAKVANSPLPSFMPGYDKDVKPYNYDPEKAKQMLKDLGKENLSIKFITYSNPRPYNPVNGQKLAEAIQGYLAKVGVKAEIVVYPWKEYKEKTTQGEGDLLVYGWIGDNGDPDNFLSLMDSKEIEASLNVAKYTSKEVDELLAKGRSTPNGAERNNIYKQIQQIVAKDAPWLPISYAQDMAAYSAKVSNFRLHPTGVVFLQNVDKQ